MPQIELIDTVTEAGERALDAVRHNTTRAIEGAGVMPERALVGSLRTVREQARRRDVVGVAARTFLDAVNASASEAVGFFTLVEKESSLPRRRAAASPRARAQATTPRTGARRSGARRLGKPATTRVAVA